MGRRHRKLGAAESHSTCTSTGQAGTRRPTSSSRPCENCWGSSSLGSITRMHPPRRPPFACNDRDRRIIVATHTRRSAALVVTVDQYLDTTTSTPLWEAPTDPVPHRRMRKVLAQRRSHPSSSVHHLKVGNSRRPDAFDAQAPGRA
jgi:hypothetical protein